MAARCNEVQREAMRCSEVQRGAARGTESEREALRDYGRGTTRGIARARQGEAEVQ